MSSSPKSSFSVQNLYLCTSGTCICVLYLCVYVYVYYSGTCIVALVGD